MGLLGNMVKGAVDSTMKSYERSAREYLKERSDSEIMKSLNNSDISSSARQMLREEAERRRRE